MSCVEVSGAGVLAWHSPGEGRAPNRAGYAIMGASMLLFILSGLRT